MNFFSMVAAIVVLTMSPALPARAQKAPEPSTLPPAPGEPPRQAPADRHPHEPADKHQEEAPTDQGQRQRIEGVVQSVEGSTMKLKASTGHIVVVDLSRVSRRVHEITNRGETVTVIGVLEPGSDRLVAQAVIGDLKDLHDPAAAPGSR
jgi:hypothetical protein